MLRRTGRRAASTYTRTKPTNKQDEPHFLALEFIEGIRQCGSFLFSPLWLRISPVREPAVRFRE
jgi:hypothetical protein